MTDAADPTPRRQAGRRPRPRRASARAEAAGGASAASVDARATDVTAAAARDATGPEARGPLDLSDYNVVALVLQGGGALGAYQGGVIEGLTEAGIEPTWFAGVSIGAVNAAIMAGNPPGQRLDRLHAFWRGIARKDIRVMLPDDAWAQPWASTWSTLWQSDQARTWRNMLSAWMTLGGGLPGFFQPRPLNPWLAPPGAPGATSYYDASELRATLLKLVDWDLLNDPAHRLSVGATNVETGNIRFFDTREERVGVDEVMASGALPPAFAPVRIGNGLYWDGGIVSNTPLQFLLEHEGIGDTLAFQVDLFSSRGRAPRDMMGVLDRQKEIGYSSRTRAVTDAFRRVHTLRLALRDALRRVPEGARSEAERAALATLADLAQVNIIQLTYRKQPYEGQAQDYEFSLASMEEHWRAGLEDTRRTLRHRDWLRLPPEDVGVVLRDVHRDDPT